MAITYSDCFNSKDILYCKIGNGKAIVGNNSTNFNNAAVNNIKSFEKIIIPERINGMKITEVGSGAFVDQKNLISVTIKANIKQINSYAFYFCINLKAINVPATVEFIGHSGISSTTTGYGLSQGTINIFIEYPSRLKTIGAFCFEQKENINLYYGGFLAPTIDHSLFKNANNIAVYSPEQMKFGNETTIGLGKDFFSLKKCSVSHYMKTSFSAGIKLIANIIYILS